MKSLPGSDEDPADTVLVPASLLAAEQEAHAGTKARLRLLENSLTHFSPHELLRFLGKESVIDVELGNHAERFMSILFADIRDFTALSERMTPQQTFDMINSYLMTMGPTISTHGGIIDKYIGDGIMALFPDPADAAVHASVAMLSRLDEYNAGRRRAGYSPIQIGIGINTGILMLGMIGSQNRMEGTVISDAVNIAARLESLTKEYGIPLLISEHTLYGLTDPAGVDTRYLGRVKVRGKTRGESIYEVFNHDDPCTRQAKRDTLNEFDEAISYYHLKQISRAQAIFESISEKNPGDLPVKVYLARCELFQKHQVHEDTGELLDDVKWTDAYRVGVADIDRDHRQLLEKMHDLVAAVKAGQSLKTLTAMLDSISIDIDEHFGFEEMLMNEHCYAFAKEHAIQHAAYRRNINRLLSELERNAAKPEYLALSINRLMIEWLVNHTLQVDRHLARFLRERAV